MERQFFCRLFVCFFRTCFAGLFNSLLATIIGDFFGWFFLKFNLKECEIDERSNIDFEPIQLGSIKARQTRSLICSVSIPISSLCRVSTFPRLPFSTRRLSSLRFCAPTAVDDDDVEDDGRDDVDTSPRTVCSRLNRSHLPSSLLPCQFGQPPVFVGHVLQESTIAEMG